MSLAALLEAVERVPTIRVTDKPPTWEYEVEHLDDEDHSALITYTLINDGGELAAEVQAVEFGYYVAVTYAMEEWARQAFHQDWKAGKVRFAI